MIISRYLLQVTPDLTLTRTETGVDLTFFYGLSGSYDPDTELFYWAGEIIAELGDDQGYVSQEVDRPMDLSFSATLEDGVTEFGRYEINDYGDRGAYLTREFAVTTFSSAADYQGVGPVAQFVFGSEEADRISGNGQGDVFDGGGGADTLFGGGGRDQLIGGRHADLLTGGVGMDTLKGGSGDDRLEGGIDQDRLSGGAGADEFLFSTRLGNAHADHIRDFVSGEDKILLDDANFIGLSPGALPAGSFAIVNGPATELQHRILYNPDNGMLFYDSDGSKSGEAQHFGWLRPGTALTAEDFLVV